MKVAYGTLFVTVVMWSNHLDVGPIRKWGNFLAVIVQSVKDMVLLLAAGFAALVPLSLLSPTYLCQSERARAFQVLLAGVTFRGDVEQKALSQGTLAGSGQGLDFQPTIRAKWGLVTKDGQIVVAGDDPPVVFTFTPALANGTVTWTCQGFPAKFAPMMCRN